MDRRSSLPRSSKSIGPVESRSTTELDSKISDLVARTLAQKLPKRLQQQITEDSRQLGEVQVNLHNSYVDLDCGP